MNPTSRRQTQISLNTHPAKTPDSHATFSSSSSNKVTTKGMQQFKVQTQKSTTTIISVYKTTTKMEAS
jgi:hypothetical protein